MISETQLVQRLAGGHNVLLSYHPSINISSWDPENSSFVEEEHMQFGKYSWSPNTYHHSMWVTKYVREISSSFEVSMSATWTLLYVIYNLKWKWKWHPCLEGVSPLQIYNWLSWWGLPSLLANLVCPVKYSVLAILSYPLLTSLLPQGAPESKVKAEVIPNEAE